MNTSIKTTNSIDGMPAQTTSNEADTAHLSHKALLRWSIEQHHQSIHHWQQIAHRATQSEEWAFAITQVRQREGWLKEDLTRPEALV